MDTAVESSPRISAEERAFRLASVNFARGNVRYEGFILDADIEALFQRYVDGELTIDELVLVTKAAVA